MPEEIRDHIDKMSRALPEFGWDESEDKVKEPARDKAAMYESAERAGNNPPEKDPMGDLGVD